MKPARLLELDFVRTLATFYVIGVHTLAWTVNDTNHMFVLSLFFDNAVPLFLILSGTALGLKYADQKTVSVRTFYRRNLSKLFWPYVVWSCFYFISNLVLMRVPVFTIPHFSDLFFHLIGGRSWSWYHLYYLPILLLLYLLFPVIFPLIRKHAGKVMLLTLLLFVTGQGFYKATFPPGDTSALGTWMYVQPGNWLFLFCFGILIACNWDTFLQKYIAKKETFWVLLMLFAFILYYALYRRSFNLFGAFELNLYTRIFYSLTGFIGLLAIGQQVKALGNSLFSKFIHFIVPLSFLIYLVHPFVLVVFDQFTRYTRLNYPSKNLDSLLFYFFISTVSVLISYLLYQLPGSYFLGGRKKQARQQQRIVKKVHPNHTDQKNSPL